MMMTTKLYTVCWREKERAFGDEAGNQPLTIILLTATFEQGGDHPAAGKKKGEGNSQFVKKELLLPRVFLDCTTFLRLDLNLHSSRPLLHPFSTFCTPPLDLHLDFSRPRLDFGKGEGKVETGSRKVEMKVETGVRLDFFSQTTTWSLYGERC